MDVWIIIFITKGDSMNVTPISYRAYNSKNQTNQQSPNFKGTIVITAAEAYRHNIRQMGMDLVEKCRTFAPSETTGCITNTKCQIHIWVEDTLEATKEIARRLRLHLSEECFPATAFKVSTNPLMTKAIKRALRLEAPFINLSQP